MNTSDLRDTLASHATFEDDAVTARVVGVRERVRVVRRRRRAAIGGAVAAVLVIAAAGVAIPKLTNDAAPVNRELAGYEVPKQFVATGFAYEFSQGAESRDGVAALRLKKSDAPRLISWATKRDGASLKLNGTVLEPGLDRAGFRTWEYVEAGEPINATLTGDGALAVYVPADEAPAGVTKDGITYRADILGDRLLGAVIGDKGETSVETTVTLAAGRFSVSPTCTSSKRDTWMKVALNGEYFGGSSCGPGTPERDPGAYNGYGPVEDGWTDRSGRHFGAGDQVTVAVALYASEKATEPIEDAGARIGVGVHTSADHTRRISGQEVSTRFEQDGHVWELVETRAGSLTGRKYSTTVAATDRRTMVSLQYKIKDDQHSVDLYRNGRQLSTWSSPSGNSSADFGELAAGRSATLGLDFAYGPPPGPGPVLMVRYARAD